MKLSEIKKHLDTVKALNFRLTDGSFVPEHFHVTEVGMITKHFIDCGGVVRHEKVANFQLWDANDFEHRLKPAKLLHIIGLSEKILGLEDLEIEVEYQANTIGKYDLGFDGKDFLLLDKRTACLAQEGCGVPKQRVRLSDMAVGSSGEACCNADTNCCI